MRPYLITLGALLLCLLASCGGRQAAQTENELSADSIQSADTTAADTIADVLIETPMPKAADELFDDFIFNFAASRKLQMERINFPLPVIDGDDRELLRRGDWHTEHFFMQQGFYTLLFDTEKSMEAVKDTTVQHVVVEKILLEEDRVTQYVFDRIRGTWKMTSIRRIPVNETVNASFLSFYHRFASDKEFQMESLTETVTFVGPDPDDDFSEMEGVITADTWEAFAPELPSDLFYNITYGKNQEEGDSKVFVLRGIANGFELQMTFKRKGDKWKLTKLIT